MGLIGRIFGGPAATTAFANAATNVAEVFVPNATRQMELSAEAYTAALGAHSEEFKHIRPGLFDRFVNGLNRLPRPMLALGTLGLFVYAMVDPVRFAERMVGLAYVPEPLWWLLGAIVGFYFGAREAHYVRGRVAGRRPVAALAAGSGAPEMNPQRGTDVDAFEGDNPALAEWRSHQGS